MGDESSKVQVVFDYPFFSLSTCTLHFSDRSRYCVLRELNKLFLLHNTIINSSGFIYRLRAKTTQVLSSAHCVRFFCSLDPVRLMSKPKRNLVSLVVIGLFAFGQLTHIVKYGPKDTNAAGYPGMDPKNIVPSLQSFV